MRAELLISIGSLMVGVLGSWIAFVSFQGKQRDEIFKERERLIIADENIKQLQRDSVSQSNKLDALFRRCDEQWRELQDKHRQSHAMLQAILRGDRNSQ